MNNILNTLGTLFQNSSLQNFNSGATNTNQNQQVNQSQNPSQGSDIASDFSSPPNDYPEVFFTSNKTYSQNLSSTSHTNLNNQSQQGSYNSQFLSPSMLDLLKNFLPMISGKNSKQDLSSILKTFSPNFSNIFSLFTNNKKTTSQSQSQNEKSLDLSNLTKTN